MARGDPVVDCGNGSKNGHRREVRDVLSGDDHQRLAALLVALPFLDQGPLDRCQPQHRRVRIDDDLRVDLAGIGRWFRDIALVEDQRAAAQHREQCCKWRQSVPHLASIDVESRD